MRAACISTENCPYKSDTGYCGYTGNGCIKSLVQSVRINAPSYKMTYEIDISDESIKKIADAVVKKLEEKWENGHNYILDPNLTQRKLF